MSDRKVKLWKCGCCLPFFIWTKQVLETLGPVWLLNSEIPGWQWSLPQLHMQPINGHSWHHVFLSRPDLSIYHIHSWSALPITTIYQAFSQLDVLDNMRKEDTISNISRGGCVTLPQVVLGSLLFEVKWMGLSPLVMLRSAHSSFFLAPVTTNLVSTQSASLTTANISSLIVSGLQLNLLSHTELYIEKKILLAT